MALSTSFATDLEFVEIELNNHWKRISCANSIVYGKYCQPYTKTVSSIYGFDMDGTLLTFNKSEPMAQPTFLYTSIYDKLKELVDSNAFIFILTNQACIEDERNSFKELMTKIDIFESMLPCPIPLFLIPYRDFFRKSNLGCLYYIYKCILNVTSISDIQKIPSFFVGDGAGRHKDFTDADVLFAINSNFQFYTPEYFFNQNPTIEDIVMTNNNYPSFNPLLYRSEYIHYLPLWNTILSSLNSYDYIFLLGAPFSGKTWFQQHYMNINQSFSDISDLKKLMNTNTKGYTDVYISNSCQRKIYLNLLKKSQKKSLCLIFERSTDVIKHLKRYRRNNINTDLSTIGVSLHGISLTSFAIPFNNDSSIVDYCNYKVYMQNKHRCATSFYHSYQEPALSEGFTTIYKVPLIPGPFKTQIDEDIFFSYLS